MSDTKLSLYNPNFEGQLYETGTDLQSALRLHHDYDTLRPPQRAIIKRIAMECNEFGHSISFDQLKSHRRYSIGRGLIDLLMSDNCDELLISSICFSIQGVLFKSAGGAIGHLDAIEAEQFAKFCHKIRWDEQDIEYDSDSNIFQFPYNKEGR